MNDNKQTRRLNDMGSNLKPVNAAALRKRGATLPQTVEKIKIKAVASLVTALGDLFAKLDDAIYDMADRAETNKEQNNYFDALRDVRVQRRGVEMAFRQELNHAFEQLPSSTSSLADNEGDISKVDADSLALLDHDELEEKVAIDAMITKSRRLLRTELTVLNMRLDSLIPQVVVTQKNCPLDPKQVCSAFVFAMTQSKLDIKVKIMMFKLFEKTALVLLKTILTKTNKELIKLGILPELKVGAAAVRTRQLLAAKAQASAGFGDSGYSDQMVGQVQQPWPGDGCGATGGAAASGQAAAYGSAPAQGGYRLSDGQSSHGDQTFAMLEGLLRQSSNNEANSGSGNVGGVHLPQEQFVSALSGLQRSKQSYFQAAMSGQKNIDMRSTLLDLLQQALAASDPSHAETKPKLSQSDDHVLDLVSKLFEFILNDPNLSESIKVVLGRLQIPILKVALLDKSFFSLSEHPARRLIDEMATAGIGINDQEKVAQDNMCEKITSIVDQICSNFDSDPRIFIDMLVDFEVFVAEVGRRASMIEQRTKDAEEGRAKTEQARELVDNAIAERLDTNVLPQVVSIYLNEVWSSVLFLVCLRDGLDSVAWKQAVVTMDDLIESVQFCPDEAACKERGDLLPRLSKGLQFGLNSISYNRSEIDQLNSELQTIQVQCLGGFKPKYLVEDEMNISHNAYDQIPTLSDDAQNDAVQSGLQQGGPEQNQSEQNQPETASVKQPRMESNDHAIENLIEAVSGDLDDVCAEAEGLSEHLDSQDIANPSAELIHEKLEAVSSPAAINIGLDENNVVSKQGEASQSIQLPAEDPDLISVQELEIGQWVELDANSESSALRCKLAARLRTTQKLIFVNRLGIKVAEKDDHSLALELKNGSSTLLSDSLLFDRALESVITDLRSTGTK